MRFFWTLCHTAMILALAACDEQPQIPNPAPLAQPPEEARPAPDTLWFYTSNDFFIGARIVVRNSDGETAMGQMPSRTNSLLELDSVSIASPGGLAEGFRVTIYNRQGKVVKFATDLAGRTSYDNRVMLYLHVNGVCPNRHLWPEMYVDDTGRDVLPVGRTPSPPPSRRAVRRGC